jgi:hypothetical protein
VVLVVVVLVLLRVAFLASLEVAVVRHSDGDGFCYEILLGLET